MRNHKLLFLFTITFFVLGFVNIHFSLLGMICMTLPIILLLKDRKKTWCQSYCPRASLYTTCGKSKKWASRKTPRFFIKGNMKWIMLAYFGLSLLFIIMSTLGVARGMRPAMEYLRFLILIPLPFKIPQLFDIMDLAPWLTHLSYRFYSMMMTTTFLGLLLALIYKPRTWCTICPIATVSDALLKK
jgi:hypothetical protein